MCEYVKSERMKWVDVYKGIMIILVVVGHATGQFNSWIYQFHMVAFFFISGYLCTLERRNGIELIIKKFFSIMLPYYAFSIIGIFVNMFLNRVGIYEFLFGDSYVEIGTALKGLFFNGNIFVQYLGTFWFLAALFGVELCHILIYYFVGKKVNKISFIISLILYILGYFLIQNNINVHVLPIICISQFYFFIGMIYKKIHVNTEVLKEKKMAYIFCALAALLISIWGRMNGVYMDLASKAVKGPCNNLIVACASIVLVLLAAYAISRYLTFISRGLQILGKNSLGIMIFHFLFFKMSFVILYQKGVLPISEIVGVVLSDEFSRRYWLFLTIFSILGSMILWLCIKRIPILRTVTGQNEEWNRRVSKKIGMLVFNAWFIKEHNKLDRKKQELKHFLSHNKKVICEIILFFVITFIPLYRIGIMINDELQARALAMQGFNAFFKTNFSSYIRDGRLLAAPVDSIFMYLGFIGAKYGTIFRFGQIIIICLTVISFGWLIYRMFDDYELALLAAILSAACMSITFEHVSPNAFVALFGISFIFVLISLSLYITYIQKRRKAVLIVSMVLFFLSQMSYETFVTYVVLFFMIAVGKTGFKNIRENIWLYLVPFGTAVGYLICYVICGKFFSSGYSGNQIGFVSIQSSLKIIINLFVASLPGFYVFMPRYQMFSNMYSDLNGYDYIRIFTAVTIFGVLCGSLLKTDSRNLQHDGLKQGKSTKKHILVILCGISYIIFPSLPISISEMYQGNVGLEGFLALPVNFFEYFAAVFVLSYSLLLLKRKIGGKFYVVITLSLCILVINIQQMNDIFSRELNKNYERLVKIETMLNTSTVTKLSGKVLVAPDLYKQQNALAIHDGYWTMFCNNNLGKSLKVIKEDQGLKDGYISFDDDNFAIITDSEIIVLSFDEEYGVKAVKINDNDYMLFDFRDSVAEVDEKLFVYKTNREESMATSAGYSLLDGAYSDGWLSKNSHYMIRTGEAGKIHMGLYYPGNDYKDKRICVFLNDIKYFEGKLEDQNLSVDIETACNEKYEMKICCDFEFMDKGSDIRELSIILSELTVE